MRVTIIINIVANIGKEFFSLAQVFCIPAVLIFTHTNIHTLIINQLTHILEL